MGVDLSAPQYVSRRPYVSSAQIQICRFCLLIPVPVLIIYLTALLSREASAMEWLHVLSGIASNYTIRILELIHDTTENREEDVTNGETLLEK